MGPSAPTERQQRLDPAVALDRVAQTLVPVLGAPIPATALLGFDALLSIAQMLRGVAGERPACPGG